MEIVKAEGGGDESFHKILQVLPSLYNFFSNRLRLKH